MSQIKDKQNKKPLALVGDLKLNQLNYSANHQIQKYFFNLTVRSCVFTVTDQPLRITNTSETAANHILKNTLVGFDIKSGIIKNQISFGLFTMLMLTLERANIRD